MNTYINIYCLQCGCVLGCVFPHSSVGLTVVPFGLCRRTHVCRHCACASHVASCSDVSVCMCQHRTHPPPTQDLRLDEAAKPQGGMDRGEAPAGPDYQPTMLPAGSLFTRWWWQGCRGSNTSPRSLVDRYEHEVEELALQHELQGWCVIGFFSSFLLFYAFFCLLFSPLIPQRFPWSIPLPCVVVVCIGGRLFLIFVPFHSLHLCCFDECQFASSGTIERRPHTQEQPPKRRMHCPWKMTRVTRMTRRTMG